MNLKIKILALALLSTTNVVFSQTNIGKTGALLWKISGKDLSKPSYLLGTFHIKPAEFLDSIPGVKAALSAAEQVVGELTLTDQAKLQMQVQQAMMMPSDTTYQMLYSDEEYQFVSEQLTASIGAGLDQLKMLIPSGISMIYVMATYQKYFPGNNPANTIDIVIQKIATENNKPILGLETIDDQFKALFGASLKRQAERLLCSLKNPDYGIKQAEAIIEGYNQFDLDKIYNITLINDDPCPSSQQETDKLNKNRNDRWMQALPDIMKQKSSFIAVGALHLVGEDGLLYQLEKSGYAVEPVLAW